MNKPVVTQVPAHTNNYSKNVYTKTGIVLHWIVGSLASADKAFQDPGRKASVHYGVGKNGEIHQYVDDKYTAYHAGVSKYNQSYFGIEHEGGHLYNGERIKPSPACHESSARLVAWLCKTYNIPCDRKHIIKHSETGYATQCCGTLDIDYIVSEAIKLLNNQMAQWCIDKGVRDASAANMDAFLNKYRKDVKDAGVDPVEWWVRNGSAEIPLMYEKKINEIEALNKSVSIFKKDVDTLNATIGGLTTDRNKYKSMVEQLNPTIEMLTGERNTLKIELEGVMDELKAAKGVNTRLQQQLDNVAPKIEEFERENVYLKSKVETQKTELTNVLNALKKCKEGKKGTTMTEIFKKLQIKGHKIYRKAVAVIITLINRIKRK